MSIGTKLVLLLTLTVGAAMFLASFLSLRVREAALETALRDELRAHAITLQIALEENFANGEEVESGRVIDRLRENSRVYAVLMFDEKGLLTKSSQPSSDEEFRKLPEITDVLTTRQPLETVRQLESGRYLSVIMPLAIGPGRTGALEMVKPLALIEDDVNRSRLNWLTTTVFLLAVIFVVVSTVLNRSLTKPFQDLLHGANAIGRGDLEHRVDIPPTRDELALLALEFNRMADKLTDQRKVAEVEAENRLRLERELRHNERLASVGRLAAGVAHELGAPLNVIDARAEQLIERADFPPERQLKNLTIIRAQTERITRIVKQLLTLARPFNFRFRELELVPTIASIIDQFSVNAQRQQVLTSISAFSNPTIEADREYLQQVFSNIILNALQAMKDGGTLDVAVDTDQINGISFASVTFTDSGAGIAEKDLAKVFDPFFTTKDVGEGTGLGLAVAHRIIEEHNGMIEASTNPSGGAVFRVLLPLTQNLEENPAEQSSRH